MNKNAVRPVTIASICGSGGNTPEFLRLVDQAAAGRPDLIVLPENWQDVYESIDSAIIMRLRGIARENSTYILHPTQLKNPDGTATNTALLIDREGDIAGRYDKIYPYWPELETIAPGALHQPIISCDFGRLAVFICFDANFPDIWADAALQGAELVVWPSAYGAGHQLQAHAYNHHYPIVTSTLAGYCMAFDIDGEQIINVRSDRRFVQWLTLDLDRCIFHQNFNEDKLAQLLDEQPPRIEVEKRWPAEEWIVVRSAQEGVSAREVCRQAGMEELRAYKRRSREFIDGARENAPRPKG
jgi:predicted amidohydrolase